MKRGPKHVGMMAEGLRESLALRNVSRVQSSMPKSVTLDVHATNGGLVHLLCPLLQVLHVLSAPKWTQKEEASRGSLPLSSLQLKGVAPEHQTVSEPLL